MVTTPNFLRPLKWIWPGARFMREKAGQAHFENQKPLLRYKRARIYSAQLGRFISRDPLGFVDGMNLYRAYFVPRSADPLGLFGDPLPKQCKVPPDDCFTLIDKMGRFANDYAKRLREWNSDKGDIRGEIDPSKYNPRSIRTHYDLLEYTTEQAAKCYFLALEECSCPVPHPRLDPIPEYPKPPYLVPRIPLDPRTCIRGRWPEPPVDPWGMPEGVGLEPGDLENLGPIAVGLGSAIIVCTLIEDVVTVGGGVADDPPCFYVGGRLICAGLGY